MGVGKEALRTLEDLARKQVQIYDDAADVGIFETDEIRQQVRDSLAELRSLEGGESDSWGDGYQGGTSYKTRLGFEVDDGQVHGVLVEVSRNVDRKRLASPFFFISITRSSWPPK